MTRSSTLSFSLAFFSAHAFLHLQPVVLVLPCPAQRFCIKCNPSSAIPQCAPASLLIMRTISWIYLFAAFTILVTVAIATTPALDHDNEFLSDLAPTIHFKSHGQAQFAAIDGHLTSSFDLNEPVFALYACRRLITDFQSAARETKQTVLSSVNDTDRAGLFGLHSALPTVREMEKQVNRSLDLNNDVRILIGAVFPPDPTSPGLTDLADPAALMRIARQILSGILAGGSAILGYELSSLFSTSSYSEEAITDLEANQDRLLAALRKEHQRSEDASLELDKALRWTNARVASVRETTTWESRLLLLSVLTAAVTRHSDLTIHGINSLLVSGQLPAHLLRPKRVQEQLDVLAQHAKKKGLELLLTSPLEVYKATSLPVTFRNGTVRAVTPIPLAPLGQQFDLYELIDIPIRIDSNRTKQIRISTAERFLAVSRDRKQSAFVTMTSLEHCRVLRGRYVCRDNPILSRDPHATCAKSLFLDNHRDIIATCTFSTVPAAPGAWEIGSGDYAIFLPSPETLTITCHTDRSANDRMLSARFSGLRRLSLPDNCRAFTSSFIVQRFEELIPIRAPVTVDASLMAALLVTETELRQPDHLNVSYQAAVPRPYSDPTLLPVRHGMPMPWYYQVLIGMGATGLIVAVTLVMVLFCRYRPRTREARIHIHGHDEQDQELKPMAPLCQAE